MVEPFFHGPIWKKMYWYLIGFAAIFWGLLIWCSFYFPQQYSDTLH